MRKPTIAVLLAGLLAAVPAFATDYVQAQGSTLAFGGMYQGEAFAGRFPGFETRMTFDPQDLASARLDVTIPLAAATTGNADYDGEMRGKAFLDSAAFPQARYTASRFRHLGGDRYAADGVLSRHGVEKPVTLEFTWTAGAQPLLILAALIAVYIVLGVLYESLAHPLTIISTLPSAGLGALLALQLFGTELSLIAFIGIILLIGIVKKNAIMMIDFALDAERNEGMNPHDAIYKAALLRFRPILMTSLAFILGVLPLAVSSGAGGESTGGKVGSTGCKVGKR